MAGMVRAMERIDCDYICVTPFFFRRRCKVGSRLSVNLVLGVLSVGLTNKANPFSLELREGRY